MILSFFENLIFKKWKITKIEKRRRTKVTRIFSPPFWEKTPCNMAILQKSGGVAPPPPLFLKNLKKGPQKAPFQTGFPLKRFGHFWKNDSFLVKKWAIFWKKSLPCTWVGSFWNHQKMTIFSQKWSFLTPKSGRSGNDDPWFLQISRRSTTWGSRNTSRPILPQTQLWPRSRQIRPSPQKSAKAFALDDLSQKWLIFAPIWQAVRLSERTVRQGKKQNIVSVKWPLNFAFLKNRTIKKAVKKAILRRTICVAD